MISMSSQTHGIWLLQQQRGVLTIQLPPLVLGGFFCIEPFYAYP
jgi:hypothetical protein